MPIYHCIREFYTTYKNDDSETKLEQREDEIFQIECRIKELRQLQQDVESLERDKKQKTYELEILKELRQKALNIRNAVRYIESIKEKNQKRKYKRHFSGRGNTLNQPT